MAPKSSGGQVFSTSHLVGVAVDTTGDGIPDAMGYDTNGDGVLDSFDTTGDGLIDSVLPRQAPLLSGSITKRPSVGSTSTVSSRRSTEGNVSRRTSLEAINDALLKEESVEFVKGAENVTVMVLRTRVRRWQLMSQITTDIGELNVEQEGVHMASHQGVTETTFTLKDSTGGPLTPRTKEKLRITVETHLHQTRLDDDAKESEKRRRSFDLCDVPRAPGKRSDTRVLIIGPGFGAQLNPRQGEMINQAGFQVNWMHGLVNPESPGFRLADHIPILRQRIAEFNPHIVVAASKGGPYISGLWERGWWYGPVLLINAHPTVKSFPKNVSVVLSHGSNDEVYPTPRKELERLISTGSENRCFLYHTSDSGLVNGTHYSRRGDFHNQESLLAYDCLPRLMDAALCRDQGPETHMMKSWNSFITPERLNIEQSLGWKLDAWRRFWTAEHLGVDPDPLRDVKQGTEEQSLVFNLFKAMPTQPRAYTDDNPGIWNYVQILRIQRVENGAQMDGSVLPYYRQLRDSIEEQGLRFEPGLHTRWLFHGSSAVESIVTNPLLGFQPLASGQRSCSVWGPGTYFARDAKYVNDGGFASIGSDGTRQMILALVMTGMPCLGDCENRGVPPIRQAPHRYNSCVDSLSNPEVFITQVPGAAYPAYVITYRPAC